ncbi:hypothetical protein PAXINDRAFT_100848 [Paxillus involutus ATCC 200175]|uniref:Zn(2)-C6 fungal-type domain-containing protein n=1 Tax=Paxillus involutus ATCC 200175 TaxID=664439 RepID=A0A0C9TS24_PAXIN|nr:hypothetical protein PAXINDRAFT_100848 [Paxillus involutus ATCC 200175]
MSSPEDDYNEGDNPSLVLPENKKRRVQRACDICRRKKIRCRPSHPSPLAQSLMLTTYQGDGSQMPGNRCSNCIAYNLDCTYLEAAKKRGPPKGYVESLENRLEKMEKLLQRVCPDADFTQELGGMKIEREMWQRASPLSSHVMNAPSPSANTVLSNNDELVPSDDEDVVTISLSDSLKNLSLDAAQPRFYGKSSGITLIQKAIDMRKVYIGEKPPESFLNDDTQERYPWEGLRKNVVRETNYVFPEEDLGSTLVDLYFVNMNSLTPLLHRPSFERRIRDREHLHDSFFGAVYLLVCAVGSRFSDDPRIFLEGTDSEHSVGWKYFEQVQVIGKTFLGPPSLEDLQVYCLSVMFLQGMSAPQACWTIVGIGIRIAQDVGAHRRKAYNSKPSADGELWKRAFWVLVTLDRQMSSLLGRPCAIQDEDFDLDLPIECDDEYWDHPDPEQAFKQPPDKPSTISFFTNYLKLNHILAFALRTIYSINKSKVHLGFVGQQWEEHIVAEHDSALNKWIDAVPQHLRWDPTRETNSPFFMQSSALYTNYYLIQIYIHRPFIPSPGKLSLISFPSLAICTNAARSCSHVIDVYKRRSRASFMSPFLQTPAFTAGIVLAFNIWGGKQSGLSIDPEKEMADVGKCMSVLKRLENRWHVAKRYWGILRDLAAAGDLPLPESSPQGGTKRVRDSESPPPLSDHFPSTPPEGPRPIAGSRRVQRDVHSQPPPQHSHSHSHSQPPQPQHVSPTFNLPLYTNELGRLPIRGQVNFSSNGFTATTTTTSTSPAPQRDVHSQPPPQHSHSHSQPPQPQHVSPTFNLPLYTNELGRLPIHGQVNFSSNGFTATTTTSTSPAPQVDSNMWYSPLLPGAGAHPHHPPSRASSAPSSHMHDYAHAHGNGNGNGNGPPAYTMDELFYDQMGTFNGGYAHPSPDGAPFSVEGGGAVGGVGGGAGGGGRGSGRHGGTGGIQALIDAASMSGQPGLMSVSAQANGHGHEHGHGHAQGHGHAHGHAHGQGHGHAGVDPGTLAMWSTAPTGFELSDWGAYITNASGTLAPDGSAPPSRHGHPHAHGHAHPHPHAHSHGHGHGQ